MENMENTNTKDVVLTEEQKSLIKGITTLSQELHNSITFKDERCFTYEEVCYLIKYAYGDAKMNGRVCFENNYFSVHYDENRDMGGLNVYIEGDIEIDTDDVRSGCEPYVELDETWINCVSECIEAGLQHKAREEEILRKEKEAEAQRKLESERIEKANAEAVMNEGDTNDTSLSNDEINDLCGNS